MRFISELYVYPIKSLGGISVRQASLTDRGFKHDRRWMLVDENNRFLSQRELPEMALLQVSITDKGLTVLHKNKTHTPLLIPFGAPGENSNSDENSGEEAQQSDTCIVNVWDDSCQAQWVNRKADEWFSDMLSFNCRLAYMPESSHRLVDDRYAHNKEITSFADGYPLLLIGQSSLDELNGRLSTPLHMNRFRPNIVFTGGAPYEEDTMEHFQIAGVSFFGVKRCARCTITTIDQVTAAKGKEPLKTLSGYRNTENKIHFGQNLLFRGEGVISVGDELSFPTSLL
ncbi:MOSC domain-containing protein [Flavitalea flava]